MTGADLPILDLLATRDALHDERLLLPRTLIMSRLRGVGITMKSAWLWGPRRVGKSTIAARLRRAATARGHQSCCVDASNVRSFDALVDRILSDLEPLRRASSENRLARLHRLAEKEAGAPILVIVDEADSLAVTLGQPEQNLLRSAAEFGRLRYVFVSHLDPGRLVEETPDIASRLLGITTAQRVGLLELDDVEVLFARLEPLLQIDGFAGLADRVWEQVGGHPLSVMTLAHALAVLGRVDTDSVLDEFDRSRSVLLDQMAMLWGDLSPGTRTLFENDSAKDDEYSRSEASSEGLFNRRDGIIRPKLLAEARRRPMVARRIAGGNADCWSALFDVYDRIAEINATAKARFGRGWFEATDERSRGRVAAKVSASERDLSDVVDHLSKILFEGAREPDGSKQPDGDPMKWRIPDPYVQTFAASLGVKSLRTLRNFFDHDPDVRRPIDKKADRHLEVAVVFLRLCDHERPYEPAHWASVHRELLTELTVALDSVLAQVRATA